jgi:hypothetical protein
MAGSITTPALISPYLPPNRLISRLQGCPQPWAYSEGIGSALLRRPELIADMIRQVHERMGNGFGVSVKIRVENDMGGTGKSGHGDKLTERLVQTGEWVLGRFPFMME